MPATLDAAALCKMADRGQISGGVLDSPLAFAKAVSVAAARIKGVDSPVAGQADVLVVPDLERGNMLAKQLEYMGDAASAGVVLGTSVRSRPCSTGWTCWCSPPASANTTLSSASASVSGSVFWA
jgi:phosphate acetyltransferase